MTALVQWIHLILRGKYIAYNKQDTPQLLVDEVITARGETTWNEKDIDVLKTASLLKVNHSHRLIKNLLKEKKKETLEKLKLQFKPIDDLLAKIKLEEENIALEMMKGLSAVEAFEKCLENVEFETWQSMTLKNVNVDSD